MWIREVSLTLAVLAVSASIAAEQPAKRALTLTDHSRLLTLGDPQRSPEGTWVAYTVTSPDEKADKRNTDVWMVKWDGTEQVQLTSSPDNESSPRWSPDGKYLAFLASRGSEEDKKQGAQIWLLNRAGGEAQKVSDTKGGVSDIAWSPDSTRLAFVASDVDPDDEPEKKEGWNRKTQPPIVVDRYRFKADRDGYLKRYYKHIAVFDVSTRTATVITEGQVDDASPTWSPDGRHLAFLSKRGHEDPDRTANENLWTVEARQGAAPRQITHTPEGESGRPAWSPDGKRIAVLLGDVDRYSAYDQNKLTVVPVDTESTAGANNTAPLTAALDRAVANPVWLGDGRQLGFLLQDDRTQHLARMSVDEAGRRVQRLTSGQRSVRAISAGKDGSFAALVTSPAEPAEIYAVEDGALRKLSKHNDALVAEWQLAITEDFTSKSKDGTEVHGLVTKPAGYVAGKPYPTLLLIHGGPNAQDEHAFNFDREYFAANGYVVLAINYRGSAGRGSAYQKAIYADWGNLEVVDLLGAVDEAVRRGLADPDRLGIGGWSYGGISTNYTIASDPRFKAAISGASSSMQFSMYGLDQYIVQYDQEMGTPWTAKGTWMKVSYPFFHADRIKTPTLFLGGEKDFNVPIAGAEQMYQALRSNGVDSQLVIYPGQFHGLTVPSYERDRLRRYLDWFNKYLQPASAATAGSD